MTPPKFQRNRPIGFTITELLVVIVIIFALAAVAFTMVTRIRKTADQAVVTSNMRQLSVAMLATVAEKGQFPFRFPDEALGRKRWERWILPALGYHDEIPGGPLETIRPSQVPALAGVAKTFAAPDDKAPREEDSYKLSFAITRWVTNQNGGPFGPGNSNEHPPKMSQIVRPERAAMILQCYRSDSLMGKTNVYRIQANPILEFTNGQLVAFADAHVEKITVKYSDDEFNKKYEPVTNGDK
jgi:type II secretory pathway pseudopilin PulG